jgi:penicillin-insensitive murein endopeptidase
MRWLALAAMLAGCVELGVVSDGTSISIGKASNGYLVDGVRLPDHGEGFITRDVWRARDNRFGTDELIDLVIGVSRRMQRQVHDVKLVVADLSGGGGGQRGAFHRSHQSGRDADLLYYMRDASGQPFEPDAMHVFDGAGRARDGSGITVDVPRTWLLVKELLTAPEAPVQWIFMYNPLARRLFDHAEKIGELEALIARARRTVRQPGDSARHDDHLHVRVYCSTADRSYGCVDLGPMEMLADRQAEPSPVSVLMTALTASPPPAEATDVADAADTTHDAPPAASLPAESAAAADARLAAGPGNASAPASVGVPAAGGPSSSLPTAGGFAAPSITDPQRLGRLLRTRIDRLSLRSWR